MKILSKYILKEILKVFFIILGGILMIITISNFLDEIHLMVQYKPSFSLMAAYFIYKTPYLVAVATPFALLLSILFIFSQFNRYNELMATKACGISFYKVMFPVLLLALSVSVLSLIFNETMASPAFDRAKYIKESLIKKRKSGANRVQKHLAKLGSRGRIFYIRHFDGLLGVMEGVCILEMDENFALKKRLDAKKGEWAEGKWILEDVSIRRFENEKIEPPIEIHGTYTLYTSNTPDDFIVRKHSPEDTLAVNIFRLRKLIQVLKESGLNYQEEAVNFHLKLAFPFASFILALLGVTIPFLFSTTRSFLNAALGFIFTVITAFFYMGFVTIGMSIGNVGVLPPPLAAWIANIVFIAIGFIMLLGVKK